MAASIALIRRRNTITDYLNPSSLHHLSKIFINHNHGSSVTQSHSINSKFSTLFRNNLDPIWRNQHKVPILGKFWVTQVRDLKSSTPRDIQPQPDNGDEDKVVSKKEASPEDQAVEGLSMAKAPQKLEEQVDLLEKREQLCELSRALAVLASASSVSNKREAFMRLVNKEMVEKEGTEGGVEDAKKAYRAASEEIDHAEETTVDDKVSSALTDKIDATLQKLEKEIDDVDAKIGDRWRILDMIKNDDKLIQAEGIDSMDEAELKKTWRERGIIASLAAEELRQQLRDWLDLSLNQSLPSSLLIPSRAFTVSGKLKPEELVMNAMSSLPDEVVDTIQVHTLPSEDSVAGRKRKLKYLEMQEELMKEEEEDEEEEQVRKKALVSGIGTEDVALKEMSVPSSASEAQEAAQAQTLEKREQLCELRRHTIIPITQVRDLSTSTANGDEEKEKKNIEKRWVYVRPHSRAVPWRSRADWLGAVILLLWLMKLYLTIKLVRFKANPPNSQYELVKQNLQKIIDKLAKEIQDSRNVAITNTTEDLDVFLTKVKKGGRVSNEGILAFVELFNNVLTSDDLNRSRLVNMCKHMGIPPNGTVESRTRKILTKFLKI